MSAKYKLSIIVPVYNVEKYIGQCLDSITSQKGNFEVVIINDGSTDLSGSICEDYLNRYSNISYFVTKNAGLSAARNYGLKHASGEYVWFIDGDDFIESGSIAEIVKHLEGADVLIMDYCRFYDNNNQKIIVKQKRLEDPVRQFLINQQMVPMKVLRRSLLIDNGFSFVTGRYYEDLGSMFKIACFTKNMRYASISPYRYRMREGSISKGLNDKNEKDRYWAIEEMRKNAPKEYYEEIEYQAIINIPIFMVFAAAKYRKKDFRRIISDAHHYMREKFPKYRDNRYIHDKRITNKWHRVFLWLFGKRMFLLCRILANIRNSKMENR